MGRILVNKNVLSCLFTSNKKKEMVGKGRKRKRREGKTKGNWGRGFVCPRF